MGALCFSSKALELSLKPSDEDYSFGYRRYNILAAFVNTVYLMFSFIFNFVDNLHHMVEHWEVESHEHDLSLISEKNHTQAHSHDDLQHMKEMNQYLALFTFLRMCVLGAYLYLESRNHQIHDYMNVNWLNWPKTNQIIEYKKRVKQCASWDSYKINAYSISLLIGCEFLNCIGNIWVYYLCMNFGLLENILSILKGLTILVATLPLCLDLCYTILQKVNPAQLGYLIEEKLKRLGYIEGIICIKNWHLWCLDKSYRVCSLQVEVSENTNSDVIKQIIKEKLLNKYCERIYIQIQK
eukprot:403339025